MYYPKGEEPLPPNIRGRGRGRGCGSRGWGANPDFGREPRPSSLDDEIFLKVMRLDSDLSVETQVGVQECPFHEKYGKLEGQSILDMKNLGQGLVHVTFGRRHTQKTNIFSWILDLKTMHLREIETYSLKRQLTINFNFVPLDFTDNPSIWYDLRSSADVMQNRLKSGKARIPRLSEKL